jgi:hypothetical protein
VFSELNKTRDQGGLAVVGSRVCFDAAKSLKVRHRAADPEDIASPVLNTSRSFTCPAGCAFEFTMFTPASCPTGG